MGLDWPSRRIHGLDQVKGHCPKQNRPAVGGLGPFGQVTTIRRPANSRALLHIFAHYFMALNASLVHASTNSLSVSTPSLAPAAGIFMVSIAIR